MFASRPPALSRSLRRCLPALLAALAIAPLAPAQTTRDAELPSVDAVLEKMIEATGGEKAIRNHRHWTRRGTFELPGLGISGTLVDQASAPDLRRRTIEVDAVGTILSGHKDGVSWRILPPAQGGPSVREGKAAERIRRGADFYSILNHRENYSSIEVSSLAEFNGQNCYELTLTTEGGTESTLYIDADSGLIAGTVQPVESNVGSVDLISQFSDYKEFDGVMIATRTGLDFGGQQQQVLTVEEVSFEPIEASTFDLPDSIKALVEEATSQPDD